MYSMETYVKWKHIECTFCWYQQLTMAKLTCWYHFCQGRSHFNLVCVLMFVLAELAVASVLDFWHRKQLIDNVYTRCASYALSQVLVGAKPRKMSKKQLLCINCHESCRMDKRLICAGLRLGLAGALLIQVGTKTNKQNERHPSHTHTEVKKTNTRIDW